MTKTKSHPSQLRKSSRSGAHPKQTREERDAMEAIRALAPDAVERLKDLLADPDTPSSVKVRICGLILDRTYGKSEAAIKVTSTAQTVQNSQAYIASLVEQIREKGIE